MDDSETKSISKNLKELGKELNVLFVDDDEFVRYSFTQILSLFFKEVNSCESAREALDLYENNNYDLVFSDISMPEMDGIELVTILKKKNPQQAIVMVSAHNQNEYIDELEKLKIEAFINKPINLSNHGKLLINVCKKIVDSKSSG